MKYALIEAILEQRPFCALSSLSPFLQRLKCQFDQESAQFRLAVAHLL